MDIYLKPEEIQELAIKPPYTISDLNWIAKASADNAARVIKE